MNLTIGSDNIDIANSGVAGESGIIRIGASGTHTATYLTGNVGIDPSASPADKLDVGGAVNGEMNALTADGKI